MQDARGERERERETGDRVIERKLELSQNAICYAVFPHKQIYVSSSRRATVLKFINKAVIGEGAAKRL